MPVARKSVTGLSFGKNGQTSLSESIDKLGISQSSVTGSRISRMTQLPFSFVNFLARKIGDSTHPKNGLHPSDSGEIGRASCRESRRMPEGAGGARREDRDDA